MSGGKHSCPDLSCYSEESQSSGVATVAWTASLLLSDFSVLLSNPLALSARPMGCGASKSGSRQRAGSSSGSRRASLYGRAYLPSDLADFELRAKAEEIFILADKDQDGRLDIGELRLIMYRPEMAEQAMGNYMNGRAARHAEEAPDERVTLEEFLAEVKKTYDVSETVAQKMLFIYERTLRQRNAEREEKDPAVPAHEDAAHETPGTPQALLPRMV